MTSVTNRAAIDSREGGASFAGEGLEFRAGLRGTDPSRRDVLAEGANLAAHAMVAAAGAVGGSNPGALPGCQSVAVHDDIRGMHGSAPHCESGFTSSHQLLLT